MQRWGKRLREAAGESSTKPDDLQLKRDVAIKALQSSFSADKATIGDFSNEAFVIIPLSNPGVPPIYK